MNLTHFDDLPAREVDFRCLQKAVDEARLGLTEGGIPIGAVLAVGPEILSSGRNRRIQMGSAIRHGEMDCLENAGRQPASVYAEATLYTTLSPCHMCTGAILLYGIQRVVIGDNRTFLGPEELLRDNGVNVINVESSDCHELMTTFIREQPELWAEDIGV